MVKFNIMAGLAFKDSHIEENYQLKVKGQHMNNFVTSSVQISLLLIILLIINLHDENMHLFKWWPLIFLCFMIANFIFSRYMKKWEDVFCVINNLVSIVAMIEYLLAQKIPDSMIFFLGWAVSHLTHEIFISLRNISLKSVLILMLNIYAFIRIGLHFSPLIILLLIFTLCKIKNIFAEEKEKRKIFLEYFMQLQNLEYYKYVLDKGIHSGAVVITLKKEVHQNKNKIAKFDKFDKLSFFETPYINFPAKRLFKLIEENEIFDILDLIKVKTAPIKKMSDDNICIDDDSLLTQIVLELGKAENRKDNEEIFLSNRSWGDTLIKELLSISINKNSEEINFDLIISKFCWNEQASIILVFNDISDKVIKERLAILNKHKDHLLAAVSHELKTPLNAIFGYTTELLSRKFPPDILEHLVKIKINSKLLQYQIDNILDYSQLNNNKFVVNYVRFNLSTILSQIKSLIIYNILLKGLTLSFKIDPTCPKSLISDPHRLKQLLMIIINNAIKFTYIGKIEIRIDKIENNLIRFEIKDTGIGIKEERRKNLFCLFQEANHQDQELNQHGIGLGLTLSKYLIHKLGPPQQINLNSEFGKGSQFSFLIYIDNNVQKEKNEFVRDYSRYGTVNNSSIYQHKQSALELTPVIQNRFFERSVSILKKNSENERDREYSRKLIRHKSQSNRDMDEIDEEDIILKQTPLKSRISMNKKLQIHICLSPENKNDDLDNPKSAFSFIKSIDPVNSYSSLDSTPFIDRPLEGIDENLQNSNFNFLIVDDTPLNLLILETFILSENNKNSVMKAYNGQQSIDIMIENPTLFDIVLMDCNMPVLNGYEATAKLKELMKKNIIEECPILAISAYSKVSEETNWRECGMDDFIEKPLTKNRFQDIYKIWVNKKRSSKCFH